MAVSPEFRAFVVESLGRVAPTVTSRGMFGGVGIYSAGIFFAVIDDETLFLKVDDTNRGDYEAIGTGPFRPFGEDKQGMQYYELPADYLEDADRLRPWVEKSIDVARRARKGKKK
ncbi:TfoX/Sxy family protein [Longimicrobium sp.]|uniref:TfoX/Sxy family protein n=1 Tax=Longimicrobium sp. TaxID=2029185 RepID=UPI002E302A62|nr:TfoX/Sxy family protein [Longimicrobium sp.]HEX6038224.1 TfoX/Sxy family protein [Longimicrobium sp.]